MLNSLKRGYVQLVTSGAQLLLVIVGFRMNTPQAWLICLGLLGGVSIFAWQSALRRLRAIRDTPTSKIVSAAQGYVELVGRGQHYADPPLRGKLSQLPCLWYRYTIEKKNSKNNWVTEDSGESNDFFMLNDDTSTCVVDPEQAEIYTRHRSRWQQDGHRYTEWNLNHRDALYVLGQLRTQGGSTNEFNGREALNALLAEWKNDMPALHKRFDLNNNGELDMDEWMLARQAAKREVEKMKTEMQSQPDTHIVSQPRDGKLYLISNYMPEDLARRYWLWTWGHVSIFFASLAGFAWVIVHLPK